MPKIKSILTTNYRATGNAALDLHGASCTVTAKNNIGKTSLLRGLFDRIHGEKPELVLNKTAMDNGATSGTYTLELTDGAVIEWHFTAKSEKLVYIDPLNQKTTTGVISLLQERYFGAKPFDIDSFLRLQPAKQAKELIRLSGESEELTRIEAALAEAMEARKLAKQTYDVLSKRLPAHPGNAPLIADIELINAEYAAEAQRVKEEAAKEQQIYNLEWEQYHAAANAYERLTKSLESIEKAIAFSPELAPFVNTPGLTKFSLDLDEPTAPSATPKQVESERLAELELARSEAYARKSEYDAYTARLAAYKQASDELAIAKTELDGADLTLEQVKAARTGLIRDIALPSGFSFGEGEETELFYNGYPLDTKQSLSNRYIAALKLGRMLLRELKSMHFEASALDYDNLQAVIKWADENGLQLLIEQPDRTGTTTGITYEIHNSI